MTTLSGGVTQVATSGGAGDSFISNLINSLTGTLPSGGESPGMITALSYNQTPQQPAPPPGSRQIPPYQPTDITFPRPRGPYLAQGTTNLSSDADPTPYQVWAANQPPPGPMYQQPQPVVPNRPMGTAQGYPGMPYAPSPVAQPQGPGVQQYQTAPPQGGWGDPRAGLLQQMQQPVNSPYLQAARAQAVNNLALGNQLVRQASTPISKPIREGSDPNAGWIGNAVSRARQKLNSAYGKAVQDTYDAHVDSYNKALDRQRDLQKEGFQMLRAVGDTMYAQEGANAREEHEGQIKAIEEIMKMGTSEAYNKALDRLVNEFPTKSPQRSAYIMNEYNRTRGLVDLRPYFHAEFPSSAAKQENRVATLAEKGQRMEQRGQLFEYVKRKAAAGADLSEDRASVYRATKDAQIDIANLRVEKMKLENELMENYGEPMKQAAIQQMLSNVNMMERKGLDDLFKGHQTMVSDWLRLEGMRNMAATPAEKQQFDDMISAVYGQREAALTPQQAMEQVKGDPRNKRLNAQQLGEKAKAAYEASSQVGIPNKLKGSFKFMQEEFPQESDILSKRIGDIKRGSVRMGGM